jgi:hypothetical protein
MNTGRFAFTRRTTFTRRAALTRNLKKKKKRKKGWGKTAAWSGITCGEVLSGEALNKSFCEALFGRRSARLEKSRRQQKKKKKEKKIKIKSSPHLLFREELSGRHRA